MQQKSGGWKPNPKARRVTAAGVTPKPQRGHQTLRGSIQRAQITGLKSLGTGWPQ